MANAHAAQQRQDLKAVEHEVLTSQQLLTRLQAAHDQMVNSASLALMSASLRSKADDITSKAMIAARRAGTS